MQSRYGRRLCKVRALQRRYVVVIGIAVSELELSGSDGKCQASRHRPSSLRTRSQTPV